jgi:hypothetical protein
VQAHRLPCDCDSTRKPTLQPTLQTWEPHFHRPKGHSSSRGAHPHKPHRNPPQRGLKLLAPGYCDSTRKPTLSTGSLFLLTTQLKRSEEPFRESKTENTNIIPPTSRIRPSPYNWCYLSYYSGTLYKKRGREENRSLS